MSRQKSNIRMKTDLNIAVLQDLDTEIASFSNEKPRVANPSDWHSALDLALARRPLEDILDSVTHSFQEKAGQQISIFVIIKDSSSDTGWSHNALARNSKFAGLVSLEPAEESAVVRVLSSGVPYNEDDLLKPGKHNAHALRAAALGFRTVACVPVFDRASGNIVGAVAVYQSQNIIGGQVPIDLAISLSNSVNSLLNTLAVAQKAARADTQLATLASTIPGVVYQRRVSPDGKIRYSYISESAYDLFGVTAEKILNDPEALFQHYGPDYRESFRKRLLQASKDMTLWDVEATILRPDGQTRYTHAIARPTKESDGSVLWTGVILDATRIKEAEIAASAAESRTRAAIIESLSQGLLLFDNADKLVLENSHFHALYPALRSVIQHGANYSDIIRAELDPELNPDVANFDANDELVDRLLRHGEDHLVYERQMGSDRHILVNEHRTPDNGTVVLYMDISELKRRERKIEHLAHHDSLTGLANRVLFKNRLETAIFDASSREQTVAVLCIDLDRFKVVNDTLGHHVGDLLLQEVAKRMLGCLRPEDVACRLGGDEFAIIMSNVKSDEATTSLSWRLLDALGQPFVINDQTIISGASVGIALSKHGDVSSSDILKNADLALYRAKSDGRGTFRYFEAEMDEKAQSRRLLEIELRAAIALDQLEVHYQPLVDIYTAQMIGVEALVRWNHPKKGFIPPIDFIPLAEETGLIAQIGLLVLKQACNDGAKWINDMRIAVNISPAQFKDKNFATTVKEIVKTSGLSPQRLELEITESMLLRNTEANLAVLHELKAFGIRISMDDFGTGYSSLGNLRAFPFDKIKIDRSFIGDLNKTPDAAAIIRAVLSLGRSLGMTTTAEGVETRDQLAYLRAEGCIEVQGHYYAKAMPASEIETILSEAPGRIMIPNPQM
jgi:diguanylate cyclase (GGDEF)-like protein/PAS domain S-box-containing protein